MSLANLIRIRCSNANRISSEIALTHPLLKLGRQLVRANVLNFGMTIATSDSGPEMWQGSARHLVLPGLALDPDCTSAVLQSQIQPCTRTDTVTSIRDVELDGRRVNHLQRGGVMRLALLTIPNDSDHLAKRLLPQRDCRMSLDYRAASPAISKARSRQDCGLGRVLARERQEELADEGFSIGDRIDTGDMPDPDMGEQSSIETSAAVATLPAWL